MQDEKGREFWWDAQGERVGRMGYREDTSNWVCVFPDHSDSFCGLHRWSFPFSPESSERVNLLKLVSKEQEGRSLSRGHEIFHALIKRLCYKGCPRHNVASVGWRSEWLEPRSELSDFSNTWVGWSKACSQHLSTQVHIESTRMQQHPRPPQLTEANTKAVGRTYGRHFALGSDLNVQRYPMHLFFNVRRQVFKTSV